VSALREREKGGTFSIGYIHWGGKQAPARISASKGNQNWAKKRGVCQETHSVDKEQTGGKRNREKPGGTAQPDAFSGSSAKLVSGSVGP